MNRTINGKKVLRARIVCASKLWDWVVTDIYGTVYVGGINAHTRESAEENMRSNAFDKEAK